MPNQAETICDGVLPAGFLDALPQVFCSFSTAGQAIRLAYVSRAVEDWTGIAPQRYVADALNWLDQVHPADRQLLVDVVETTDDAFAVEYRICDADRNVRYVRHVARRATSENCWHGCLEDVTSLRQTRQDMERSQMLQNMGRLAAGIAHEINTPIQFIGDNLYFLAEAWEAVCLQLRTLQAAVGDASRSAFPTPAARDMDFLLSEAPDAIRQSLDGIDRVSSLVAAMRDFSRPDERRMAPADINRAIKSTLTLLRNELKYTADVQTELDSTLPEAYCSIDEISRVLLNLLTNAEHSIKEKINSGVYSRGVIVVRTRQGEGVIEIEVEDNGMGISDAVRSRIFERFFTTKRNTEARGTGQGLAMAQSIVQRRHQGQLTFETRVGEGTTFLIRLPLGRRPERDGQ